MNRSFGKLYALAVRGLHFGPGGIKCSCCIPWKSRNFKPKMRRAERRAAKLSIRREEM